MERHNDYEEVSEYERHETLSPDDEPDFIEESSEEEEIPEEPESEENEGEEEHPREIEKKKGSRNSAYSRIQQIQREKYQAASERDRLREENEQLRRIAIELNQKAEENGNAFVTQYDNNANLELEKAKIKKLRALEDGDIQAQLDADVEIANAAARVQRSRELKAQQELNASRQQAYNEQYSQHYNNQPQINQPSSMQQTIATDWIANNPWYRTDDEEHDPELHAVVNSYSDEVENYLISLGRPDMVMSEWYFNEIDKHVANVLNSRGNNMQKKSLNMKPARVPVTPARSGGGSYSPGNRSQVILTAADKEMAKLMKIDPKDFLKHKIRDQKIQRTLGRPV